MRMYIAQECTLAKSPEWCIDLFWLRFNPSLAPLVELFLPLTLSLSLSLPEENEAGFLPFLTRASARQPLLAGPRRIS